MVELADLITSVALLVIGTVLGAIITYEFSLRLEKRQKENRRVDVVSILHEDVASQLRSVLIFENELKHDPINFASIETSKFMLNEGVFRAFLPDLHLLPPKTRSSLGTFYGFLGICRELLRKCFETKEMSIIAGAITTCEVVCAVAYDTLARLIVAKEKKGIDETLLLAKKEVDDIRLEIKQTEKEAKRLADSLSKKKVVRGILRLVLKEGSKK